MADLRANAKYARQRYQLYMAKAHGPRPTSAERLHELARACEQAESRLLAAEAEVSRVRAAEAGATQQPGDQRQGSVEGASGQHEPQRGD